MNDKRQDLMTEQNQDNHSVKLEQQSAKQISLPPVLTVKQLAELIDVTPVDIIKQLMRNGLMANINQTIDFNVASVITENFGYKVKRQPSPPKTKPSAPSKSTKGSKLIPRPPVITIMGHVDHGKTSLLDAIRKTNVVATEAGAITQHIGAYQIVMDGRKITFLDTPGHEAFTAMRARGAQITDIAVLVVAADDGVMPQTIEAIHHAQAAGVPIVVALNKVDKPDANPDKVKQQLSDLDLIIEEWGGDTICVPVSAKKLQGISELLENLLLLADILELKAKPDGPAEGVAIEAKLDKNMGPLATLLVQKGTLKIGDTVVIGSTHGKVKAMFNDMGKPIKIAEPSTPVKVLGLNEVAQAGDTFKVAHDEHEARGLLEKRKSTEQAVYTTGRTLSLSDFSSEISSGGQAKDLNIILKTDVQGSIEPIKESLEQLTSEKVKVRVIHSSSGSITESDVMLALASNGIIVGFNTKAETGAQRLADLEKVSIRYYSVIYELIKDVEKAMKGMLEPTFAEVIDGQAEVRAVFETGKKGRVAGIAMKEGRASRDSSVRIIRKGEVIHEGRVSSLKRFKNDVKEVTIGQECGVGIEKFSDFQVGDIFQFYRQEKVS
jgi:translation initiation factor IF-2